MVEGSGGERSGVESCECARRGGGERGAFSHRLRSPPNFVGKFRN